MATKCRGSPYPPALVSTTLDSVVALHAMVFTSTAKLHGYTWMRHRPGQTSLLEHLRALGGVGFCFQLTMQDNARYNCAEVP